MRYYCCAALGCTADAVPGYPMCKAHWCSVPGQLRAVVLRRVCRARQYLALRQQQARQYRDRLLVLASARVAQRHSSRRFSRWRTASRAT